MDTGIKEIEINPDWFYHRVKGLTIGQFILSGSIKAKKYLKGERILDNGSTTNGNYYICLAKYRKDIDPFNDSCYQNSIKGHYAFVIEGVDAIHAEYVENYSNFYRKLAKLPIKKRYSYWKDEYQVKKEIPLDKVVGIKIPSKDPTYYDIFPTYDKTRGIDFFLEQMESVGGNFSFIDMEEKKMIEKGKIKEYIKSHE